MISLAKLGKYCDSFLTCQRGVGVAEMIDGCLRPKLAGIAFNFCTALATFNGGRSPDRY